MKILVWCSLVLWLNVAWAEPEAIPYHNPFVTSGAKMPLQTSPYPSHRSVRESWQTHPMLPTEMSGSTGTRMTIATSNNAVSSGFGTRTSSSMLSPTNTSHQILAAGATGIVAGGLATAGLIALATSLSAASTVAVVAGGTAAAVTGGSALLAVGTVAAGAVAGVATGGLATVGLMSLATAVGTASTGTAIAGLSGAAAFNAALAWLGGGALSAGGLGMAGGTATLVGTSALAGTAGMVTTTSFLSSLLGGRLQLVQAQRLLPVRQLPVPL